MPDDQDRSGASWFVLVCGWPGSGKSTLAEALAAELRVPLLAKDEIKEALIDGLGPPGGMSESQWLGRAAVLAMLRIAQRCPAAVLDSTWHDYALPLARSLPGQFAEVHCTVPLELAKARYQARSSARHSGHLDSERTEEELWGTPAGPLGLGPAIDVDTTGPVDVPQLAAAVSRVLGRR
jgi:predicted kinase